MVLNDARMHPTMTAMRIPPLRPPNSPLADLPVQHCSVRERFLAASRTLAAFALFICPASTMYDTGRTAAYISTG